MESKLRQRLAQLRAEYDKGQQTLHELETQAASVRATLLRISGAIQVLEEALGERPEPASRDGQLPRDASAAPVGLPASGPGPRVLPLPPHKLSG